ncbi:hypothetical protein LPB41_19800 [Thalassospira sp. MA62]|nr:hypothetical protein [Thalassospira sp. MA62]
MTDVLTSLRHEFLSDLPDDIRSARVTYHRLAADAAGIFDAKEFSSHQSACKAAISHIESLIKLLRWACEGYGEAVNDAGADDVKNTSDLITKAKEALEVAN